MTQPNDIYARVTDKIIADLEKGELTWRMLGAAQTLRVKSCSRFAGMMLPIQASTRSFSGRPPLNKVLPRPTG